MTIIAVTGSQGFIGRNLMMRLREAGHEAIAVPRDADAAALLTLLRQAQVVFHLAGVNRPQHPDEFTTGNVDLTKLLVEAMRQLPKPPALVYASSIQAESETAYGLSKRGAETLVNDYARATSAAAWIFRLPNVFGKWSRPNHNSVVATFCHNIARALPIAIHDPDAPLRLVYIDDVVERFAAIADDPSNRTVSTDIEPVYRTTVGDIAGELERFRDSRTSLVTGRVGVGFLRALHATYLSYLDRGSFSYPLLAHSDPRGTFVEMLRTQDSGQISFFTAHPGVTRGGHYHHSKTEKFLVLQGQARFGFRHILTKQTYTVETSGNIPTVVETVPGWSHDITNIGDDTMIVMLWASEVFDPNRPDTIAAKVLSE